METGSFCSSVIGVTTAEDVDKAIKGRSLGVQGCHFGCLGISKGEGKNGAIIITIGVGTTQIDVNGSVMRQLTDNDKKLLKIWGFYDENIDMDHAGDCDNNPDDGNWFLFLSSNLEKQGLSHGYG